MVMNKYLRWFLIFILHIALFFIGRLLSPFACLFIVRSMQTDVVKRFNKQVVNLPRDNLVWWLNWFATDDNNVDEFWYGMYGNTPNVTQEYYDTHIFYRLYCRVMWLQRNNLYTFNRKYFGLDKGDLRAWQYENKKWGTNIGFKAHKGIERLMFAGRLFKFNNKG
jgi:hypothetical protein